MRLPCGARLHSIRKSKAMLPDTTPAAALAAATAAHEEAASALAARQAEAKAAAEVAATASAGRQQLLDRAARGDTAVDVSQLTSADGLARDALAKHDLSAAIAASAQTNLDKAQLALLFAQAAVLHEGFSDAVDARLASAARVDELADAMRAALADLDAKGAALRAAHAACHNHDSLLDGHPNVSIRNLPQPSKPRVNVQPAIIGQPTYQLALLATEEPAAARVQRDYDFLRVNVTKPLAEIEGARFGRRRR